MKKIPDPKYWLGDTILFESKTDTGAQTYQGTIVVAYVSKGGWFYEISIYNRIVKELKESDILYKKP